MRDEMLKSTLLAAIAFTSPSAQETPRVTSLTGLIRSHPGFHSNVLNNDRNLTVYLPPRYAEEPRRRYPVLYMHDGQNVFNGMTSFIPNAEWRADEAAQALIEAGLIEPIIIVGIDNAGAARADEYLPTRARNMGGKAGDYAKMVLDEIKPMIDRTYRTKTDAQNTGLCGSSFGGIITMTMGLRHPDKFGKLAVVSPSVWWDNKVILKMVDELPRKSKQRIWVDIGTDEGPGAEAATVELKDRLVRKGWRAGQDLALYIDRGAKHNEPAWAGRMDAILMYLFPARR